MLRGFRRDPDRRGEDASAGPEDTQAPREQGPVAVPAAPSFGDALADLDQRLAELRAQLLHLEHPPADLGPEPLGALPGERLNGAALDVHSDSAGLRLNRMGARFGSSATRWW